MNLLRLLTPEEISALTTTSVGAERVDLNDLMDFENDGHDYRDFKAHRKAQEAEQAKAAKHSAKIIDINQRNKNKDNGTNKTEKVSLPELSQDIQELLNTFIDRCKKMESNPLGRKRLPKRKRGGLKKQMSTFIIEEKDKIEKSFVKLKSVEIMDLYQKNAAVDIDLQKASDDLSESSQSGILVNKKRA